MAQTGRAKKMVAAVPLASSRVDASRRNQCSTRKDNLAADYYQPTKA
jgi:hypothetical protein